MFRTAQIKIELVKQVMGVENENKGVEWAADQHFALSRDLSQSFHNCQKDFSIKSQKVMMQTTIFDHFYPK